MKKPGGMPGFSDYLFFLFAAFFLVFFAFDFRAFFFLAIVFLF